MKDNSRQGFVIGLTGKMAAGKNFVTDTLSHLADSLFQENGKTLCIDADKLVHQVLESESCRKKILETFSPIAEQMGIEILGSDGQINRRELAKIVFSSKENLDKQENIIHPEVEGILQKLIKENPDKIIIVNATVLYKIPLAKTCDALIFVDCPTLTRFFRAKKRDGLPARQILERFRSQKHLFAKYKKLNADIYRVRNFGSKRTLEKQISKILESITGFQKSN